MSFSNLNKDKKIQILNISKKTNEDMLYESLIRLGIDPAVFDPSTFDFSTIQLNDGSQKFIENATKAISSLSFINQQLQVLGQ